MLSFKEWQKNLDEGILSRLKTKYKQFSGNVKFIKNEDPNIHYVTSKHGYIQASGDENNIQINNSSLHDESSEGKGHGVALYDALARRARKQGKNLFSDVDTSKGACKAWEALRKRGWNVIIHPNSILNKDGSRTNKTSWHGNYYIANNNEEDLS